MSSEIDNNSEFSQRVARRLEEELRLERFFDRLCNEAISLSAEGFNVTQSGEEVEISLYAGNDELKLIKVKHNWFDQIIRWLEQRWYVPNESLSKNPAGVERFKQFSIGLRVGENVLFGNCQLKNKQILISGLKSVSRIVALENLPVFSPQREVLKEIIDSKSGIIVVAAADLNEIRRLVGMACTLTGAFFGGDLMEQSVQAIGKHVARTQKIIVSLQTSGLSESLVNLNLTGLQAGSELIGILQGGFLERNCSNCARITVPDINLLNRCPPVLQPGIRASYKLGRGCDKCGLTGFKGSTLICSLASFIRNPEFLKAPDKARGIPALEEDALLKVLKGFTTLNSVFSKFSAIPEELLSKNIVPGSTTTETAAPVPAKSDSSVLFNDDLKKSSAPSGHIVIAEDDPDQRNILEMVLRANGYTVQSAFNGEEALKMIRQKKPALLITDLMMPKMDGSELVAHLRQDPTYQDLPILVLTVISDKEREYALLDLGADDYCEKTIQRKLLLKRVETLLRRSR